MTKIAEVVNGSLFLNQDKALKRVFQDRERGDLPKARQHALEALEKWPDDYGIAVEAIQACLDLHDYPQAANLFKNAHRRHQARREEILELARSAFQSSSSTLVGGFIVETLLKARDLEGIAALANAAPESFLAELVKRGETRAKNLAADGQDRSAVAGENALLLGALRIEAKEHERAAEALGAALEILPGDARHIGALLARIEGETPGSAAVKYHLGLASLLLAHPDKAETRFFQCLERPAPPFEKLLAVLGETRAPLPNHDLLAGEILVRSGGIDEGVSRLRTYVDTDRPAAGADAPQPPSRTERCRRAAARLTLLPADVFSVPAVAFLYADAAAELGSMKDAVAALDESLERDASRAGATVEWLLRREAGAPTGPGQKLLARLSASLGRVEEAVRAGRAAADADPSGVPSLIETFRALVAPPRERDPRIVGLLAELHARAGDRESAEEALGVLRRSGALPDEELSRVSTEIMRRCGVTVASLGAALEIGARRGSLDEALPHVMECYRERRDEHEALADVLRETAGDDPGRWKTVAGLVDRMAAEEELSLPFRSVQAAAHLFAGEVERAVFEFDQLALFDPNLRNSLVDTYRAALKRYDANATLHLALYHLHLETESFADAAAHLCRTLELDPSQIRDVMQRFERLVEREPSNRAIWEKMLATAVAMNRPSLAREVLARAVAALPPEAGAALHLYGARIAVVEGNREEALRSLAIALDAQSCDARAIEETIGSLLSRDPDEPRARFLRAGALLRLGRERDAVGELRRCLELSPDLRAAVRERLERLLPLSVEPWLLSALLGEIAWGEGGRDEALRHFTTALRGPRESIEGLVASIERSRAGAPDDGRLALLHARALARAGRHGEAAAHLAALVGRDASLAPAATEILREIVAESPAHCEANALLARLLLDAGDAVRSREALERLLADETIPADRVEAIVEPFLAAHGGDAGFLVRYAALNARAGSAGQSLERLREAFRRDGTRAAEVLRVIERYAWPQQLDAERTLLAIDCLLALGRAGEAFALVTACAAPDARLARELVARIDTLVGTAPRREHFSFGASLLAGAGDLDGAERFLARGREILGGRDACDLTIELAEVLYGAGETDRASRIFEEALAAAEDRAAVYARIERSYCAWADRTIARLAARAGNEPAFDGSTELLVELLLDRNRPAEALAALSRSALPGAARRLLLGRVYLAMDRPGLACAALAGAAAEAPPGGDLRRDILYAEGVARERSLDHGRAAAAFAAAAAEGRPGDGSDRARRNYTEFIAGGCGERAAALEITESI